MAIVAEVDITLDLPFGAVDYAMLDEIITQALRNAHVPVLDVEIGSLREANAPVDPATVGVEPLSPFRPNTPVPLGPPGPFGTTI